MYRPILCIVFLLYLHFFRLHPLFSSHDDAQQILNPKQSIAHDLSQVAKKIEDEKSVPLDGTQEVSDNMLEDVNPVDGWNDLVYFLRRLICRFSVYVFHVLF